MSNLLDRSSLVLTPTAYNNGEALCIKPDDASGDFQFSRNSAATRVNAQGLVENVQILSSNLVQNGDFSEEGVQEVSNGSFSQEGVQLVTNGSFDTDSNWNGVNTNGVTISNGSLNFSETTISHNITQGNVVEVGKSYKATLTISNYVKGSVRVSLGATGTLSLNYSSNGTFTFYGIAGANTALYIQARGASGTTLSIESVSVREVGQDWSLGTGWSIGEDKAVATNVDGTFLKQNSVLTTGKTYKITYTVQDYSSGSVRFRANSVNGTTNSGNGTYTDYIVSGGTQFALQGLSTFNGSITNISVKEVGMDWSFGTGWSIGDDKLIATSMSNQFVTQSFNFTSGKRYRASFSVTGTSSLPNNASLRLPYDGDVSNIAYVNQNSDGVYSHEFVAAGTLNTLYLGYGSFTGTITNISVIEITDDTNLPRINYEGFSYQDALGSEEIVNGSFDTDSDWTKGSGVTISNGKALVTVINGGYQSLGQSLTYISGKSYTLTASVNGTAGKGCTFFDASGNNGGLNTSNGGVIFNGEEQSVKFEFTANSNSNIILIARNGAGDYNFSIDNVSVKEYLGQEVVPNSGCGSWLFESQSTNLITQSELFSDAYWTKIGTSVTNGFTSPNGTNNACKLVEDTSDGSHAFYNSNFSSLNGQSYTYSLFVKYNGRQWFRLWGQYGNSNFSAYFDIQNGLLGSKDIGMTSKIEDYGNGWYRISATATTDGTASRFRGYLAEADNDPFYQGDGTSGVYIWGAQAEQQSYATSYIPTEGSTVTRNQDVCNNGGSLATINSTEGVLYAEMIGLGTTGSTQTIGMFSDNVTSRVLFRRSPSANRIQALVYVNSIIQFNVSSPSIQNGFNKVALKYKENDFALWINGTEIATGNSGLTPSIPLSKVSFKDEAVDNPFFGKTKALAVWKEALSDQELADLTYPTPTDPTFSLDFDTIAEQFTFARGSEATYVDAQGLIQSTNELGPELITNGDFEDGSTGWAFAGGWSVVNNQATTLGVSLTPIRQTVLVNGTNRLTFDIVQGGAFVYTNYPIFSKKAQFTTVGTHTIDLLSDGIGDNRFLYIYNNGAGNSATIDNVSVKEYTTATNTPRLDYSTGAEAFLLEPQSTNLVLYSQDYNTNWLQQNGVSSDGGSGLFYLSPTSNVIKYEVTTQGYNQMYYRLPSAVTIGNTYTQQGYVKCDDAPYIHFQINALSGSTFVVWDNVNNTVISADPSIDSYNITSLSDGWVKAEITYTATVASIYASLKTYFSTSPTVNWTGVSVGTIAYQTFVQVEELPFASSYIPTNGSQTTRNQETCINATPEINSEEGVLYAEISALANDGTYRAIYINDNDATRYIGLRFTPNSNQLQALCYDGANLGYLSTALSDITNTNKIALRYQSSGISLYVNGSLIGNDATFTGIAANQLDEVLFNSNSASQPFFGNTKNIQIYPKALSDAELINLTTI